MFRLPNKCGHIHCSLSLSDCPVRETYRALDIHEVRVGRLYESLQLVGLLLKSVGRVQEINSQLLLKKSDGPKEMLDSS